MKTAKWLAVAIVTVAGLPLMMAQQVNTQAQENASASAGGKQVNQSTSAGAGASASRGHAGAGGSAEGSMAAGGGDASASGSGSGAGSVEMRPVTGELEGKLDSKTAKTGDRVVLKTNEKMKTADGMVIPKGSRLVGHVTEVQAHEKGHAASQMGLEFDRAELRGGQSLPIRSMIQSIQPSANAMAAGSMASEDAIDTPMGGGGGAVRGGGGGGLVGGRAGGGGGGMLGGTVNSATSATGSATGRVGGDLDATAGSAVRSTGNIGSEATGSLAHGVGGAASGAGALGARATGIPGVMLNGDASGSASGMLSAANRNVHLDAGTQMVLGVAAAR